MSADLNLIQIINFFRLVESSLNTFFSSYFLASIIFHFSVVGIYFQDQKKLNQVRIMLVMLQLANTIVLLIFPALHLVTLWQIIPGVLLWLVNLVLVWQFFKDPPIRFRLLERYGVYDIAAIYINKIFDAPLSDAANEPLVAIIPDESAQRITDYSAPSPVLVTEEPLVDQQISPCPAKGQKVKRDDIELPLKPKTIQRWKDAYKIVVQTRRKYRNLYSNLEIANPNPKSQDYVDALKEKGISYTPRQVEKIIKAGDAGLLK